MKSAVLKSTLPFAMDANERRATVILMLGVVVTTLHRQSCGVDVLPAEGMLASESARTWLYFGLTFLLFAAIPAAVLRWGYRQRLGDYGVRMGDWRFGAKAVFVLLPIITVAMLLPASQMPDMQQFYPVDKGAMASSWDFTQYAVGRVLLFYVGWEFFFRGFMLFGIRDAVGDAMAIAVTTLPSALWHIGYPTGELYSSIAAGLLFGWLALRTRSVLWPLLLHAGIGIVTDLTITLSM
ncbi:CPBP family intramembrane metalloprotease [bacterium]|nr:CPBP family intramembrane metalloprotease [bacterium]